MKAICKDLTEEYDALDAVVSKLDEAQWKTVTLFYEWDIEDEIIHIAYIDAMAKLAAVDPDGFAQHFEDIKAGRIKINEKTLSPDLNLSIPQLLDYWRRERGDMLAALAVKNPKDRLPWYGPTMSARSFVTARIMETWAHGQDVYDALGLERSATERLRHVAHLGVITYGWSFANRKLAVPETPIRVELAGQGGDLWTWGPEDADETVTGSAQDFCLVVTQRRNVADTNVVATGEIAQRWMQIAQAFAGPAEDGPPAGRFKK
ncbi:MAG: TIGR03084 family protein [Deltaproteobacteria bacterium]|nr:TIGR03084 family protein [Deltaproteobacteria bacterium]